MTRYFTSFGDSDYSNNKTYKILKIVIDDVRDDDYFGNIFYIVMTNKK